MRGSALARCAGSRGRGRGPRAPHPTGRRVDRSSPPRDAWLRPLSFARSDPPSPCHLLGCLVAKRAARPRACVQTAIQRCRVPAGMTLPPGRRTGRRRRTPWDRRYTSLDPRPASTGPPRRRRDRPIACREPSAGATGAALRQTSANAGRLPLLRTSPRARLSFPGSAGLAPVVAAQTFPAHRQTLASPGSHAVRKGGRPRSGRQVESRVRLAYFFHAQALAKVKAALDETTFEASWKEGSLWSVAVAVRRAMAEEARQACRSRSTP